VTMAFWPTFWAKRFGMVTDKFGCPWIVNGEMIDVAGCRWLLVLHCGRVLGSPLMITATHVVRSFSVMGVRYMPKSCNLF
jgi:hypothetical protein